MAKDDTDRTSLRDKRRRAANPYSVEAITARRREEAHLHTTVFSGTYQSKQAHGIRTAAVAATKWKKGARKGTFKQTEAEAEKAAEAKARALRRWAMVRGKVQAMRASGELQRRRRATKEANGDIDLLCSLTDTDPVQAVELMEHYSWDVDAAIAGLLTGRCERESHCHPRPLHPAGQRTDSGCSVLGSYATAFEHAAAERAMLQQTQSARHRRPSQCSRGGRGLWI